MKSILTSPNRFEVRPARRSLASKITSKTMKPKQAMACERRRRQLRMRFKIILPGKVSLPGRTRHDGINRSLRFMAKNYWRPIQMDDLALASGLSRRGFAKAFNLHVGASPGSVLRRMRIESAKQLLLAYDLPLKTIADLCGYRSENTFCIAFQHATGTAPKKFQRQAWLAVCRNHRLAEADPVPMAAPLLPLVARQNRTSFKLGIN